MQKILILSGNSTSSITSINHILRNTSSDQYDVKVIEQTNITLPQALKTLRRSLKKSVFYTLDLIFLRLYLMFFDKKFVKKNYEPDLIVEDINDPQVISFAKNYNPTIILSNACNIISSQTLKALKAPMVNIHNGINPRYRGFGNIWAYYEDNPSVTGVTLHETEKGIDDGKIISIKILPLHEMNIEFKEINETAFKYGAELFLDYFLRGQTTIDVHKNTLLDKYYSFPGWTTYKKAKKNFKRYQNKHLEVEKIWQNSFEKYAKKKNLNVFQKMHWSNSETVSQRDQNIVQLVNQYVPKNKKILDIGCGDAHLESELTSYEYFGCDYSLPTIHLNKASKRKCVIISDARNLPFKPITFGACLSVGLFQHIQETQNVFDQCIHATQKGGYIIISTLRQFSFLELMLIILLSAYNKSRLKLALAILKKDYFSGKVIDGTMLARRYTPKEFDIAGKGCAKRIKTKYHNGIMGTAFLAREISLVYERIK